MQVSDIARIWKVDLSEVPLPVGEQVKAVELDTFAPVNCLFGIEYFSNLAEAEEHFSTMPACNNALENDQTDLKVYIIDSIGKVVAEFGSF